MNKMLILLSQLNIDHVKELKSTEITRVQVYRDNHYVFDLHSSVPLPSEEIQTLMKASADFPYPCSFRFSFDEVIDERIESLSAYLIRLLSRDFLELNAIREQDISFKEDMINIRTINEIQKDRLVSLLPEIKAQFMDFGIDYPIDLYVDEDNDDYRQIQQEMEETPQITIDQDAFNRFQAASEPQRPRYQKRAFDTTPIGELDQNSNYVTIQGYCFHEETKETKAKKLIQTLYVTDYTDSIAVKCFEGGRITRENMEALKKGGKWIRVNGEKTYDTYSREDVIKANSVEVIAAPKGRSDQAENKRIELHLHTNMSTLDGFASIGDYIKQAASFGHKAIAITDHDNVQAFPDAQNAAAKAKIKMIYGVELNMIDLQFDSVHNARSQSLRDLTYISFDLETTGLSQLDDHITEFGAVKIQNGLEVDRMQTFVRSPKPISAKITELTGITNAHLAQAPTIEELIPKILAFFGDHLLVAHNAVFNIGMLNKALTDHGYEPLKNTWIDSLPLARHLIPLQRSYRLGAICNHYHIAYNTDEAHRADYDAEVLGYTFNSMLNQLMNQGVYNVDELNDLPLEDAYKHAYPYHIIVLAKNQAGLKDLFKLVSIANTTYFYQGERIPREVLQEYHEAGGLLFGSACVNSRVFEIASTRNEEELAEEISFYDYIEIQPLADTAYLVDRGRFESLDEIVRIYQRIIKVAKKMHKPIVATGDVHFLNPRDKIFREVFITNDKLQINGRPHPLLKRGDPHAPTPDVYYRTTDEMLQCFPYLSEDEAYEYVVTNSHLIASWCDDHIQITKEKLYTPKIAHVDELLRERCYQKAHQQYGNPLPEIVESRMERELTNICKHGYAVIYYIASELVRVSNEAGYLVGSRGSVGSSFVATMSGISEVNPLAPHYYCPNCQHNEFLEEGTIANGYDLPVKKCPRCGHIMKGDGHNIPFETFLGFNADKTPDIDLNFSGEYQPTAHDYTKKIFGDMHVFRAGTISTVAEKTAFGYAKAYAERCGIENTIRQAELQRLANGCTGVKRTTGQHPGGIIVIPDDMEIFDFTPYQYPADDVTSSWKTTHFDFHKINDNVLKFDILGHVDPTVIRMLQDLTGIDPVTIPTNDQQVMSLFHSTEALGVDLTYLNCKTGALGLPEFGTRFVRSMLEQTHPTCFNELVIISGLSHGTDVYLGNAELLIKTGTCTLNEVIGCRDDIMVYLIEKGLPNKDAFDIMECVRKGKSPVVFPEKGYVELMEKHNVPRWYIDSCLKIKYMFPKAHAAAYVLSAVRVAWWKLYFPREYYAVYFTTRCDAYDIETLIAGHDAIYAKYSAIQNKRAKEKLSNKEEALVVVFEIAMEMYDRGYHFNNIDINRSAASTFILDDSDPLGILPCFTSVDGLGDSVAESIEAARREHEFTSLEDMRNRTRISNTHLDVLKNMGVLSHLSESDQLSLFDLL